jgi:hypothetical protein
MHLLHTTGKIIPTVEWLLAPAQDQLEARLLSNHSASDVESGSGGGSTLSEDSQQSAPAAAAADGVAGAAAAVVPPLASEVGLGLSRSQLAALLAKHTDTLSKSVDRNLARRVEYFARGLVSGIAFLSSSSCSCVSQTANFG